MSVTIAGHPVIVFGRLENKPTLPEGWSYEEDKETWLRVISPDNRCFYFGHDGTLYPEWEDKRGKFRMDTEHPLVLPGVALRKEWRPMSALEFTLLLRGASHVTLNRNAELLFAIPCDHCLKLFSVRDTKERLSFTECEVQSVHVREDHLLAVISDINWEFTLLNVTRWQVPEQPSYLGRA